MTKLIFITHPSVEIQADVAFDRWQLSTKGKEEAEALLRHSFWNEVQAVYTSAEPKAFAVGDLIQQKLSLPYTKVENLREIDRSSTKLMPYEEYMAVVQEFYQKPDINVRGWESAKEARQRMKGTVDEIMSRHQGEVVVVIGHGASGALLACEVKNVPSSFEEDPKRTACLMQIDWENQQILSPWETYSEGGQEWKREVHKISLK